MLGKHPPSKLQFPSTSFWDRILTKFLKMSLNSEAQIARSTDMQRDGLSFFFNLKEINIWTN